MDERSRPLEYATPQQVKRPPMYSLILRILASAFLIAFGGALAFACLATLHALVWSDDTWLALGSFPLFLSMAVIFSGAGILTMLQTINALRGIPPRGTRWERWAAWLNRTRLDGSTSFQIGGNGDPEDR